MKRLVALSLILATFCARADLVIEENVESGGQTQDMIVKIKGDKIRTDMNSGQVSTITDTSTGDIITIMHAQKSYMKMDSKKMKELMEKARAMQSGTNSPAPNQEKPKVVDTGKKEKINGYDTEIYTAETPTMKFKYWVAKDFPNADSVQQQMKKMQANMLEKLGPNAAVSVPDMQSMKGLPLKTEVETDGKTITTTLTSVKEETVDASALTVPADYNEIKMPDFGGGAPEQ